MDRFALTWRLSILAVTCCGLGTGCVGWPVVPLPLMFAENNIAEVASRWENRVVFAPDPVNNGQHNPGLAGRVYLFADDSGHPVLGNGVLKVELYEGTVPQYGPKGKKPLEDWTFRPADLSKLVRKDIIGQGYTLFLPWATFRQNISQVTLVVSYIPPRGMPVYAPDTLVTLSPDNRPLIEVNRSTIHPNQRQFVNPPGANPPGNLPNTIPPEAVPLTPEQRINLPASRQSAFGNLFRK